jgi:hypothetical protein
MPDYPAEWFSATFDGIAFGAGKGQRHRTEEEVAETLCPAVEPGVATVYRDHLGRKPPKLTLPVLVENGATSNGGMPAPTAWSDLSAWAVCRQRSTSMPAPAITWSRSAWWAAIASDRRITANS